MEYEIKTIQDIIEKIPTDKVGVCMKELTVCIIHAKLSVDIARALDPNATFNCPANFKWTDDDKGNVKVHHFFNNQEEFITREKV